MKIRRLTAFVAFAVLQQPSPPPSSIEGIVVRQGTNEPLGGVDLELSRVEGNRGVAVRIAEGGKASVDVKIIEK